jgi:hypothetical protein
MTAHEKNIVVAEAFANRTIWPRYAELLDEIIRALRGHKIGFDLTISRDSEKLCIARVGLSHEVHTAVLENPAEALCVAFLRFMGNNVQTIHPTNLNEEVK